MITYIMGYAKPEEILKYVHNRNMNQNLTLILACILLGIFKLLYKNKYHAYILVYLLMITSQ